MRTHWVFLIVALASSTATYGAGRAVALVGGGDDPNPNPTTQFYITPSGEVLMIPNPDEFGALAPMSSHQEPTPIRSEAVLVPRPAVVIYGLDGDGWRELTTIPSDASAVSSSFVAASGGPVIRVAWCEDGRSIKAATLVDGIVIEASTASDAGEMATRPSISPAGLVAYQRSAGPLEIVFAERTGTEWRRQVIAEVAGLDRDLHVQVHALAGRVWVDWVHDDGLMGYAVRDESTGLWSAALFLPYDWVSTGDEEYVAREMARVAIRQLVLRGNGRSQN